jgi:hypothetical protein
MQAEEEGATSDATRARTGEGTSREAFNERLNNLVVCGQHIGSTAESMKGTETGRF